MNKYVIVCDTKPVYALFVKVSGFTKIHINMEIWFIHKQLYGGSNCAVPKIRNVAWILFVGSSIAYVFDYKSITYVHKSGCTCLLGWNLSAKCIKYVNQTCEIL